MIALFYSSENLRLHHFILIYLFYNSRNLAGMIASNYANAHDPLRVRKWTWLARVIVAADSRAIDVHLQSTSRFSVHSPSVSGRH